MQIALIFYHFFFFFRHYKNPYLLSTSENASTFFPHWIWMGRQLRNGIFPAEDKIYYETPGSISFLATFYPPWLLTSYLGSFLSIDKAFKFYSYTLLIHSLVSSFLWYFLFLEWYKPEVALFGTLTISYAGYMIKLQQPTIAFTMAWIPGIFYDGVFGMISMAMALFGGYYPILIYLMPFIAVIHPIAVLGGIGLALSQLIPFWGYFKKSIRIKEKINKKEGRVPLWKFIEMIIPWRNLNTCNGILPMEYAMYIGFLPFLFIWFSTSRFWFVLFFGLAICLGILRPWQRIPARALYIVTLSISILATDGLSQSDVYPIWPLVILQAFLLFFNSRNYPAFPFNQWWNKPSKLYKQKPKA